jgi:mannose-6-phosphate isomerase-like protein (cupin superfamily)
MLAQDTQTLAEHGRVILPGEGKDVSTFGDTLYIKLGGEETGGALAIVEGSKAPGSSGPTLHVHGQEDEILYIVEGALRVQLGEQIFTAGAGTWIYMPRGVAHAFCNPFDQPARMLGIMSPAGFEHYFEEAATLAANAHKMSREEMIRKQTALGARYGGETVGPPMSPDVE